MICRVRSSLHRVLARRITVLNSTRSRTILKRIDKIRWYTASLLELVVASWIWRSISSLEQKALQPVLHSCKLTTVSEELIIK
jgi:hypothetical protein